MLTRVNGGRALRRLRAIAFLPAFWLAMLTTLLAPASAQFALANAERDPLTNAVICVNADEYGRVQIPARDLPQFHEQCLTLCELVHGVATILPPGAPDATVSERLARPADWLAPAETARPQSHRAFAQARAPPSFC